MRRNLIRKASPSLSSGRRRPLAGAADRETSRASCPLRTSVRAAQYTPAKRNQQVIESATTIETDL
jgi:hypothetical protein